MDLLSSSFGGKPYAKSKFFPFSFRHLNYLLVLTQINNSKSKKDLKEIGKKFSRRREDIAYQS